LDPRDDFFFFEDRLGDFLFAALFDDFLRFFAIDDTSLTQFMFP